VSSVRVLEVKGFDKVGWSGRSEAAVKGARRSGSGLSAKLDDFLEAVILTFNSDVCVRIEFCRRNYGSLSSLIIIVAIDFVAIFVDKRRIPTYDLSMKSCVFYFLCRASAQALEWSGNGNGLFCRLEARWVVPIDPREHILPSSSICCLDW
jgi:hypothetical protein